MSSQKDEFIGWQNEQDEIQSKEYQETNHILDGIKEEFFDNRIRACELTKEGLIRLMRHVKPDQTLEFLNEIKEQSIIIELGELKR